MVRLSPHFTLDEFTRSYTATRLGIDNTPNDEIIHRGKALCTDILEPIKDHYNGAIVNINSGYRGRTLNRALGSKDTSQHIKFEAADYTIRGYTPYEVAKWVAEESDLNYDQVILEFNKWVHISYTVATEPRKNALTIFRKHGKVVTSMGILLV